MIQVDDRAGSAQFGPLLRKLGVEVEMTRMDFGDVAFTGIGASGMPCSTGVELKSFGDVLSCVVSGRFSGHQLPGLIRCYDYVWLLIYGVWRGNHMSGVLEEWRTGKGGGGYWAPAGGGQRQWLARDFESWLLSMTVCAAIRIHRVPTVEDAAQWIKTCHSWFQKTEHKSHLAMQTKELFCDVALMTKPPLARRVAAELPNVGIKRSQDVAMRFKTVEGMVAASENDWRNLVVDDGKKMGVRGAQVYRAIRGHNDK